MLAMIFRLVGGVGLFLLGMALLTDGLKALAGEPLRRALVRFTGKPWRAFLSGAVVTLLVQSSSATTVTVIGFVSAGLLTFPQALAVVMGASLGTTGTGWIVAVLGLKISVGFYALPLVGIGAFLKLFGGRRWKPVGLALAGFGLIFIGIETMQAGMSRLTEFVQPARLPSGGLVAHVLAMVVGVLLTILLQSSSVTVAITLTALHTATINFEQAASLVIGAAIGTTVTGVLAAIGGTTPAKRTALGHVTFNLATGVIAVVLLPGLLRGIEWAQQHLGLDPGATSLAAFHSTFIAVGVAIFLPMVDRFARWIERVLPERERAFTRHLDDTLLNAPPIALEAVRRALRAVAEELLGHVDRLVRGEAADGDERLTALRQSLLRAEDFLAHVPAAEEEPHPSPSRVALIHALDHLMRLWARASPPDSLRAMFAQSELASMTQSCREIVDLARAGLRGEAGTDWTARVERMALALSAEQRRQRAALLQQTAGGAWSPGRAVEALDAMRWLERLGYHTWRIVNYLAGPATPEPHATLQEEVGPVVSR